MTEKTKPRTIRKYPIYKEVEVGGAITAQKVLEQWIQENAEKMFNEHGGDAMKPLIVQEPIVKRTFLGNKNYLTHYDKRTSVFFNKKREME